jgi:hypothetical protein
MPPVTINVPVVVVVDDTLAVRVTAPDADNVVTPDREPLIANKLLVLNAPPTPIPPVTTKAPVVVVVDAVAFVKETIPEAPIVVTPDRAPLKVKLVRVPTLVMFDWEAVDNVPDNVVAVNVVTPDNVPAIVNELPVLIAPPTPSPPLTTKAPVVVFVEAVAFVKETTPEAPNVVTPDRAPLNVKLVSVPKLVMFG